MKDLKGTLIELNNCQYIWIYKENLTSFIVDRNDDYEFFLEKLTEYLNETHGVRKSKKYYRILLGNWLLFYIHTYWDRYTSVLTYGENKKHCKKLSMNRSDIYIPYDYNDFFCKATSSDIYNLQLYTRIYDYVFPNNKLDRINVKREFESNNKEQKKRFKTKLLSIFFSIIRKIQKDYILISEPYFKKKNIGSLAKLIFYSGFRVVLDNKSSVDISEVETDYKKRVELKINTKGEFRQLIALNVLQDLPVIFLEDYKRVRLKVLEKYPKLPKVIYTSTALHGNYNIKFLLAEFHQKIFTIGQQHGATYGLNYIHSMEEYEKSISNIYLTSGWNDNDKCIPFCIPRLCNNLGNNKYSNRILFVTTSTFKYLARLEYYPRTEYYRTVFLSQMSCFLGGVNLSNKGLSLIIRPYPSTYGLMKVRSILKESNLIYRLEDTKYIGDSIVNYKIVVMDHLGTTMLDTMNRDIPTVVYIDPEIQKYRSNAVDVVKKLIKSKILHESPVSAYHHINNIADDIESWWHSPEVRMSRREFTLQYANNIRNWEEILSSLMIKTIINGKSVGKCL